MASLTRISTCIGSVHLRLASICIKPTLRMMSGGDPGSGAGKGGGSGGSIRDAGGAFGRQEAAREEEYFRKQQRQQLENIKSHLNDEVERHEQLIRQHEEAIKKTKQKIAEIQKHEK